jgi:hypothetical protein
MHQPLAVGHYRGVPDLNAFGETGQPGGLGDLDIEMKHDVNHADAEFINLDRDIRLAVVSSFEEQAGGFVAGDFLKDLLGPFAGKIQLQAEVERKKEVRLDLQTILGGRLSGFSRFCSLEAAFIALSDLELAFLLSTFCHGVLLLYFLHFPAVTDEVVGGL